MTRKIMVVNGSPRKNGNTHTIASWFREGAESAGAHVTYFFVSDLAAKAPGCIACMGCKQSEAYRCVIDDDISDAVASILDHDCIVIATPVYFFGPSAKTKIFLDRTYSLTKFDPVSGKFIHPLGSKRFGILATAGGTMESGLSILEQTFETLAVFFKLKLDKMLIPQCPINPEDMKLRADIKERAMAFGIETATKQLDEE